MVAFVLSAVLGGGIALGVGCSGLGSKEEASGEQGSTGPSRVSAVETDPTATASATSAPVPAVSVAVDKPSQATTATPDAPYTGPYLGAMAFQTPIYPEPRFGDERLGYIRQGGKVPVDPTPIKRSNCKQGWYKLVDGGYVCGKYSTLDLENDRVKLGVRQPDLAAITPYQYAYNRFHGTPMYRTLPTRDEMRKVEPHIVEAEKKKQEEAKAKAEAAAEAEKPADSDKGAKHVPEEDKSKSAKHAPDDGSDGNVPSSDTSDAKAAVDAVAKLDTGTLEPGEAATPEPPKPWWQTDEKKPAVSLSDLEKDAEGSLSKRMVKGFYVAVDKTLAWNDRTFYRTTSGLLTPTDRMWMNKAPDTHGVDWPEGAKEVFFALGEKAQRFELTKDQKSMKAKGKLPRFTAVALTGKTMELSETTYREALDGTWVKAAQGTITAPNPRPKDVGEDEKWVDVNLDKKTLVLFHGDKPVFAALISPGKKSKDKKKNHATPTGAWRVREKHVAVTMDGDGAAGDLPYSIEDVPYVAYFKGSYALHAAFWHNDFGREKSHGCVNLAPADAKVVFNFIDPIVPRGWHAAFATKDRPGSMIVIHE